MGTLSGQATSYLALLAFQFGIQPILVQSYAPAGINRSSVVLMQEFSKFIIAGIVLSMNNEWKVALKGWTVQSWLTVAMVPATLYAVQNVAYLSAFQTLDALTFNVLAQTKTLSAALNCYLLLGRSQSRIQIMALCLLLLSALIMEGVVKFDFSNDFSPDELDTKEDPTRTSDTYRLTNGILPILLSTFISGLAGALSQRSLQNRNSYLFSMELCAAQTLVLLSSLLVTKDGSQMMKNGFWYRWSALTWLPIVTGAGGGVLVGLVTKHAGAVYKGFALIGGMFLSGVLQSASVSWDQAIGGALAAVSIYLHTIHPPKGVSKTKA